jgi:hypothetical protein
LDELTLEADFPGVKKSIAAGNVCGPIRSVVRDEIIATVQYAVGSSARRDAMDPLSNREGASEPSTGAPSPPPIAALAYEAPPAEAQVTSRAIQLFRQTRPWTLFLSIFGFIVCGLMLAGGAAVLVGALLAKERLAAFAAGGYFVGTLFVLLPSLAVFRFARRISDLSRLRRHVDLEAAIDAQRSVWKTYGILTIVFTGLYLVFIVVMIVYSIRR